MTFSVVKIQDNQPQVVGTLWADNENNARSLAPQLCGCVDGSQLRIMRTDDREIPLRLAPVEPMKFC
jgi:hypothetical protein